MQEVQNDYDVAGSKLPQDEVPSEGLYDTPADEEVHTENQFYETADVGETAQVSRVYCNVGRGIPKKGTLGGVNGIRGIG